MSNPPSDQGPRYQYLDYWPFQTYTPEVPTPPKRKEGEMQAFIFLLLAAFVGGGIAGAALQRAWYAVIHRRYG